MSVPALKNDRDLHYLANGQPIFAKNKEVVKFLRSAEQYLLPQVHNNNYSVIIRPQRVRLWIDIYFFAANPAKALPRRDGDNALTTLQETLQSPDKSSGICNLIEDDCQVGTGIFNVVYVPKKLFEGATIYLWILTETQDVFDDFVLLRDSRQLHKQEVLNGFPQKETDSLVTELFEENCI